MKRLRESIKILVTLSVIITAGIDSYALNIDTVFLREEKIVTESKLASANLHEENKLQNVQGSKYSVGDRVFVDINLLKPTQVRKFSLNVQSKIKQSKGLIYDSGKSNISIEDAIPVFKGPNDFLYVIDDHNIVLASLENNVKTIPVFITDDLSDLKDEKFWEATLLKKYGYLIAINGQQATPPQSFNDLKEDILGYFVSISAFKCTPSKKLTDQDFQDNIDSPLWLKVGKSVPFIEFNIANILYKNKFTFVSEDRLNKEVLRHKIEEARKILLTNPLDGLILLPKDHNEALKIYKVNCEQEIVNSEAVE